MPSLFRLRTFVSLAVLAIALSSACVIRLEERNEPEVNGGVTGPTANCRQLTPEPRAQQTGPAGYKYVGRFVFPDEGVPLQNGTPSKAFFDWSGNNISFRFQGTTSVTVKLRLLDQVPQDQLFAFVVDGKPVVRQITVQKDARGAFTNTPLVDYVIDKLSTGPHEVVLWKNTEAQKGGVQFEGAVLGQGGEFLPHTVRARKMEVIGDSIICGYGNEGENATCPFDVPVRRTVAVGGKEVDVTVPLTENQFLSYTSQAARILDADVTTICWSGKGLYLNYKEAKKRDVTGALVDDLDAKTTVPKIWSERTLAADPANNNKWDWGKEKPEDKPQVVLISLGTNDFSRDEEPTFPDDPERLPGDGQPDGNMSRPAEYNAFRAEYLRFVTEVREKRPDAHIFIATPPMLTNQFPLDNARNRLRAALDFVVAERAKAGDNKVYAMNLVEMGFRYGLGCDYHPNLEVHQIMANQLVGAIRTKTCW